MLSIKKRRRQIFDLLYYKNKKVKLQKAIRTEKKAKEIQIYADEEEKDDMEICGPASIDL